MKLTACFLAGFGAGIVVGILNAPKSGDETQAFLRKKGEDGLDYAKRYVNEGSDYLRHQADEAKKNAAEGVERIKSGVTDPVNAAVEAGRRAYREAWGEAQS
jgi:gas vesicle protein